MSQFTRFGQIFWGLMLVILDFRFDGFDILPDFLGYILVAIGCGGLLAMSPQFATAKTLSWILAVLSPLDFLLPAGVAFLIEILELVLGCAMMWFLLGGIIDFANSRERPDLSARASHRRIAYLVLMSISTIAAFVLRGGATFDVVPVVVIALSTLVLLALILHLIYRVRYELTYNASAPDDFLSES